MPRALIAWLACARAVVLGPRPRQHARRRVAAAVGARGCVVVGGADVTDVSDKFDLTRWSESQLLGVLASVLGCLFCGLAFTRAGDPPPLLPLREVLAGGLAAAIGEVSLYPLEVVKVRLQTGAKQSTDLKGL